MTEEPVLKGGPTTQEGKKISRKNGTRHGLCSPAPVVPGIEKEESWLEHRNGVLQDLNPQGHLESVLAEQVASLLWRRNRVVRFEAETIAPLQEEAERRIYKLKRLEETRRRWRFVESLKGLSDDDPVPMEEALAVFMRLVERRTDGYTRPFNLKKIPLPETPQGDLAWTAGDFHAALAALTEWSDLDVKELLKWARGFTYCDVKEAEREANMADLGEVSDPAAERDRVWQERILPNERGVEKIIRYEAHLGRELNRTLDQLKALQGARRAQAGGDERQ